MRHMLKHGILVALAAGLSACSGGAGLLDTKSGVPMATNVQVGNNLALPPDLQLAAPTQTSDAYQSNGPVAQPAAPVSAKASKLKAGASVASADIYGNGVAAPAAPPADVFAQYGISKVNPDGTAKSVLKLNEELRAAVLKKKRETNPSYGTIGNIGAIFQDQ